MDVTGPAARVQLVEGRQVLLDVPVGPRARLMHPALADPDRRAGLQLVLIDEEGAVTRRTVDPPPDRRYPPAWALGAVWYQVFPDRFDNANPDNDPATFNPGWTSRWSEVTVEELEAARAARRAEGRRAQVAGSPLSQVVYQRRYGGDLQGVARRLDHMADLGATAIYLNPVFEAHSLHKYDASDHRHIDPTLGAPSLESPALSGEIADPAWTPADRYVLDTLLPTAHQQGLRVIFDGVWNHVGTRHWAFQDVLNRGRASAYADWFRVRFARESGVDGDPNRVVSWTGWDGPNGTLPEFRQTDEGDLVAPVKSHVFNVTHRWMDPDGDADTSDGIDGWRLDVVPDIGLPFWRDWNAYVRSINPKAITIAEVWHRADDHLQGDTFDAQMNYPVREAVLFWLGGVDDVDSAVLVSMLRQAFASEDGVNLAQMNLLGSHDTTRVVTRIAVDRGGSSRHRPGREDYELALLGVALQVALPGAPCIYNGDEWGVWGANDPHNRKPVPWPDVGAYDAETAPLDWVKSSTRTWLRTRQDPDVGRILRYGTWQLESPRPDLLVIDRRLNDRRVRVIANRSGNAVDLADLIGDFEPVIGSRDLPARSATMWISK